MCVLDTPAQCICYNPDGTMLAVGLGGGLASDFREWNDYEAQQVSYASTDFRENVAPFFIIPGRMI